MISYNNEYKRHFTHEVLVGDIKIGGCNPVVVQSMTNTDTSNIEATVKQVLELYNAGAEIVRVTVNTKEAAKAIGAIKDSLIQQNCPVKLAGCFHYNGHTLLTEYAECAVALDKYRINPGNVGFGSNKEQRFSMMVETAIKYNKPIRIGVNWGSLDEELKQRLMDENSKSATPLSSREILYKALVLSAIDSAALAENIGLSKNHIILSCKVSATEDLIQVYTRLAEKSNYALHLGLTEAGMGMKGYVATSSALSILLRMGIGDTIRASITPAPGEDRANEVHLCKEILQSLGLRNFKAQVTSCPGCGRTTSSYFQQLTFEIDEFIKSNTIIWNQKYKGSESMKIAVMGCIVNGPGESKHANIGISLPGTGESPIAPVFIDGEKKYTLRGNNIAQEFQAIIERYLEDNYAS